MGEISVLCVSSPNDVKYEFSCMRLEESCKLLIRIHFAYAQDACPVSERGLGPLAPMACGGV